MQTHHEQRTFLVRYYTKHSEYDISQRPASFPIVTKMTVGQWQKKRPGRDIRDFLVSSDHRCDFADAVALAEEIAIAAGDEWDAREDIAVEAVEWLLETASQLRNLDQRRRKEFLQIPNLSLAMKRNGLAISDVVAHYRM